MKERYERPSTLVKALVCPSADHPIHRCAGCAVPATVWVGKAVFCNTHGAEELSQTLRLLYDLSVLERR